MIGRLPANRSGIGRRLLVSPGPVPVSLPAIPPGVRTSGLRVTLGSGSDTAFACWEFPAARPRGAGRLYLSFAYLDQSFAVLDQAGAPPTASAFWVAPIPEWTKPLELLIEWAGSWDRPERHTLGWSSPADRDRLLADWTRQQITPAEWFYVEITTRCNLHCSFCPSKDLERDRQNMSLETAATVFGRIGDYVARRDRTSSYVQLQQMVFLHVMGEPLLHPELVKIAHLARSAGLVPALLTNVTLLDDRNVERVLDAGLGHVTLSINTATDEGYVELGGRGSLRDQERRALALLRARAERGGPVPHVDIQYMMKTDSAIPGAGLLESRDAVWDLYRRWLGRIREETPPLGRSVDPRPRVDPASVASPQGDFGEDPTVRLPLHQGIDLVIKTACTFGNVALEEGYSVEPTQIGQCPFHNPFRQLAVFVDGSTSFCNLDHENSVALGSLIDMSLEDLWSGARMQHIRSEMLHDRLVEPVCQRCLGAVNRTGARVHVALSTTKGA